jgi:hypothetical protein
MPAPTLWPVYSWRMSTVVRTAMLGLVSLAHGGLTFAATEVTSAFPLDGAGVTRGVVLIRCTTGVPDVSRLSRGAVLDLGHNASGRDIVLTTAHGLPDQPRTAVRSCNIVGEHGRPYRIERVWFAAVQHGVASDWAVLLIKGRLEGDVGRLGVGQLDGHRLATLAVERGPVRLLLRQADPTEGDCRLLKAGPRYEAPEVFTMYQCRLGLAGTPGLSGSPLLMGVAGRSLVVGIHVGWALEILGDGRSHPVGVGRPVDESIAAAIEAATAEASRTSR